MLFELGNNYKSTFNSRHGNLQNKFTLHIKKKILLSTYGIQKVTYSIKFGKASEILVEVSASRKISGIFEKGRESIFGARGYKIGKVI